MAEINRIKSFKTFSEVRANEAAAKLAEENANKRSELTAKIAAILDDMNITSFENLEEDVRKELITRAFGEISEEAEEEDLPEVSEDEVEESEEAEYVSEAIVVTGKRDANKVKKAYEGFFQSYPALGRNALGVPKIHHIGAIKSLYAGAMEDANFSREVPATVNQMKGRLFPVEVKVADLNNAVVKVSTAKLNTLIDMHVNAISGAAKWSGLAIVEGTALYLDSIGETKQAENLMAAFNKTFEGNEVNLSEEDINERNAFLAARAKAIEEDAEEFEFNGKKYPVILNEELITEGEREEQWAMEIYTDIVGPDGEFSEDELAKAGRDTFEEIVKDAGYKGSRGKKLTDILVRIATESFGVVDATESLFEATVEMDAMDPDNKDFVKFLKKNKVKIVSKEKGPNGHPVIVMQGKRKDLEAVLADEELGWADADLAEYIEESIVNENYEVIYRDGVSQLRKFRSESQAIDFMKKEIKSNKKLKEIAVYKPGMYSTTQTELVVTFWGNGSYLDNVSKRDEELAAKKLEESVTNEAKKYRSAKDKKGVKLYADISDLFWNMNNDETGYGTDKSLEGNPKALAEKYGENLIEAIKKALKHKYKAIEGNSEKQSQIDESQAALSKVLEAVESFVKRPSKNSYNKVWKHKTLWWSQSNGSYIGLDGEWADNIIESNEINEAEINSDEEFKEYAETVLQKAFGEDYDEAKATKVIDGILSKVDGDYGAAVGMLTSSLGESVEVAEANADGTISDDEDERREKLEAQTEADFDQFLKDLRANAEDIGGSFRSPGIMADNVKVMKQVLKKNKIRF